MSRFFNDGGITKVERPDGSIEHYRTILVGGQDDIGIYEVVLEGPAEGEKVYVEYF